MKNNPSIKILILNWNGCNVLEACLESVIKIDYNNFSTIVIDNGSSDNSCDMVRKKFPKVELFELGTNFGYAKGYNKYFESDNFNDSKFILLLNNDTIVKKNILTSFIKASSIYGPNNIFGPKIFFLKYPKKIWYAGGKINLKKGLIQHLGIREFDSKEFKLPFKTDYVTGCCLFTSSDIIIKLKGFDENFNMYGEDVDFCIRAYKEKISSYFWPEVEIFHHVSWSMSGKRRIIKLLKKFKSLIKLYRKHQV